MLPFAELGSLGIESVMIVVFWEPPNVHGGLFPMHLPPKQVRDLMRNWDYRRDVSQLGTSHALASLQDLRSKTGRWATSKTAFIVGTSVVFLMIWLSCSFSVYQKKSIKKNMFVFMQCSNKSAFLGETSVNSVDCIPQLRRMLVGSRFRPIWSEHLREGRDADFTETAILAGTSLYFFSAISHLLDAIQ